LIKLADKTSNLRTIASSPAIDWSVERRLKYIEWARAVGAMAGEFHRHGTLPPLGLRLRMWLANLLVLRKLQGRVGGRIRFFVSGGGALSRDVAEFFYSLGLPILEGYGLTETSPVICVNGPGRWRVGTVGRPLRDIEVKIADDGEILLRGPGVMSAYHDLPDATAEALEQDGWFHTGDIGEIDADGFLRITDRKKDMFKTSNGKYVAPSAIDATFKGISPYVSHLVVDGEGRSYCVALIALDADAVRAWANENGMGGASFGEVARSDKFRATMQADVDRLNSQLNRWESIKKFAILDRELTVDDGEITPSMKVRRKIVLDRYRSTLDTLYGD
jgi:long-chain acyl-CoA synthetase